MQEYKDIDIDSLVSDGPDTINKNFKTIMSNNAGGEFPTENLYAGMICYRSDEGKLYTLKNDLTTWVELFDVSGANGAVTPKADALTKILTVAEGGTGATNAEDARKNLGVSGGTEEIKGSGAGYHNSIYRGKYLGSSVTDTQWAAIKAGTFEDMYLGDYWTIGGVDWVIMAFDYYLNCGNKATTAHHIVIVPQTILYSAEMNTSITTSGGYVGSEMYTTNLANAKTTIANAFGSSHILTIRQLFVNAVTDDYSSNGAWTNATVWLMNEINVYGCKVFGDCIQGTNWAFPYTMDNSQYPAFMFNPNLIKTKQTYWLRDVASSSHFADVGSFGICNVSTASSSCGVRPAFCIYQS